MLNIIKNKLFFPFLTFIFIIPAFSFLLKPGYYNMHDDMQMIRQLEMEKCLKDGQIPCRWTPDLGYGYGYPLFNFYPPLPYIIGQVYRTLNFSYVNSVKATAITQIILSAFFMYLLSSSIFGPIGGFLSSIFFTYAPYHALNIYIRGAMNEAWASVFFPLTFYFSRKLVLEKKIKYIIGLGTSFAFLLLSHNPMALTFSPLLFLWTLMWIFIEYKKPFFHFIKKQIPTIIKLSFSMLLTIGLTAFYTLPVLFESKYVQISTMFQGYYHFSVHFVSLFQLFFSNFWGDGASVWGPNDDMSFMVGYLHWIIPIFILIMTIKTLFQNKIKYLKKHQNYFVILISIIMGFGTLYMTHNKSTFIWLLFPIIQKIQFPWRFLNHSVFLFSFSVGGLYFILEKYLPSKKIFFVSIVSILLLLFNKSYFIPIKSGPITDEEKFSGLAWTNQVTSGIYDYLPKTAQTAAKSPAKEFVDKVNPENIFYTISNGKKGSDWMYFNLHLSQNTQVTLSQLAFPSFEVLDNNQIIPYNIEPDLGRIVLNLKSGDHQLMIKFVNTPIRTISNYISLFFWIFLLLYLSLPIWKKLIYKK